MADDRSTLTLRMGAEIDASGHYRYTLWREWNRQSPRISFVMLNPSTADSTTDDATIRRCIRFAQVWSYGSLEVVNLFAYRATQPQALCTCADPIGVENDRYLLAAVQRATAVLFAWGNWGRLQQRDRAVVSLLAHQRPIYCLGLNRSGQPRHPLYVKGDTLPMLFQNPVDLIQS